MALAPEKQRKKNRSEQVQALVDVRRRLTDKNIVSAVNRFGPVEAEKLAEKLDLGVRQLRGRLHKIKMATRNETPEDERIRLVKIKVGGRSTLYGFYDLFDGKILQPNRLIVMNGSARQAETLARRIERAVKVGKGNFMTTERERVILWYLRDAGLEDIVDNVREGIDLKDRAARAGRQDPEALTH